MKLFICFQFLRTCKKIHLHLQSRLCSKQIYLNTFNINFLLTIVKISLMFVLRILKSALNKEAQKTPFSK